MSLREKLGESFVYEYCFRWIWMKDKENYGVYKLRLRYGEWKLKG